MWTFELVVTNFTDNLAVGVSQTGKTYLYTSDSHYAGRMKLESDQDSDHLDLTLTEIYTRVKSRPCQ